MVLNIKLDEGATMPSYSKVGDSGLDLVATSVEYQDWDGIMVCKTGVYVEIPEGYTGLLFPRSSVSNKYYSLANSVGVIDSNYRGEIIFKFRTALHAVTTFRKLDYNHVHVPHKGYAVGDRVGQLVIIKTPVITLNQVTELSDTNRGDGGFGSSGA